MKTKCPTITWLSTWLRSKKFLHRPCISATECICRCASIPCCFTGSSSQNDRGSTCPNSWFVLSKIRQWRKQYSKRRSSSQSGSRGFNKSRTQGLAIIIRWFHLIWHAAWRSEGGSCNQKESSRILLQRIHTNIISSVVWWNPTLLSFTQRDIRDTQGSSRRYVCGLPTWTQTWGRTLKAWLLLAKNDFWCYRLH